MKKLLSFLFIFLLACSAFGQVTSVNQIELISEQNTVLSRWQSYEHPSGYPSFAIGLGINAKDLNFGNVIYGNYFPAGFEKKAMFGLGVNNLLLGNGSGKDLENGDSNVFAGSGSFGFAKSAKRNVGTGFLTGAWSVNGVGNVYSGYRSGAQQTNIGTVQANYNTFSGYESGYQSQSSSFSYFGGAFSGRASNSKRSIFLGAYSGFSEQDDFRLIVQTASNQTPIINGWMSENVDKQILELNAVVKPKLFIVPEVRKNECTNGELSYDQNFLYVCVQNQRKQIPFSAIE